MATDSEQKKQRQDQKTVIIHIFVAFILVFCFVLASVYIPFPKLHLPTLLDRVVFTLRCLVVSVIAIVAGVTYVERARWHTVAINPLNPNGKKFTELRQNCLQNTVEQFLIHSFSIIALSTYLTEGQMHTIPLLIALFVIARALFFVGYSIDPIWRSVGFAMTWFPTLLVSGYCLYCICVHGVQAPQ